MWYMYRTAMSIHGPFQCAVEDFKRFWAQRPSGIKWCRVELMGLESTKAERTCYRWTKVDGWQESSSHVPINLFADKLREHHPLLFIPCRRVAMFPSL